MFYNFPGSETTNRKMRRARNRNITSTERYGKLPPFVFNDTESGYKELASVTGLSVERIKAAQEKLRNEGLLVQDTKGNWYLKRAGGN